MKRDFVVFLLISFLALLFWRGAFSNFFAQDDFIFIKHFSQNGFWVDLENAFGKPEVTHWRPLHNFYFLISGNLFGTNYFLYHALTILLHIGTGFLVYKVVREILKGSLAGLASSLIYVVHPAHFVPMYWISGAAINIGFFLLLLGIYLFLLGKRAFSMVVVFLSLLASEAMIVGIFPIYFLNALKHKKLIFIDRFLLRLFVGSAIFVVSKILFLTPPAAFNVYQFDFSTQVLTTFKYYALRTLGFAESSGDLFASIILVILLAFIFVKTFSQLRKDSRLLFPLAFFAGIFPFLFLPDHLSPHYMVLPIFGFAFIFGLALSKMSRIAGLLGVLLFLVVSFVNIGITQKNSWVTQRGEVAKKLISDIQKASPDTGSTIVFGDNSLASSFDKYIALGEGSGIDLFFQHKQYQRCFTFSESCPDSPLF